MIDTNTVPGWRRFAQTILGVLHVLFLVTKVERRGLFR